MGAQIDSRKAESKETTRAVEQGEINVLVCSDGSMCLAQSFFISCFLVVYIHQVERRGNIKAVLGERWAIDEACQNYYT